MKACENPKCPFHIEVDDDVIRYGLLHFLPEEKIACSPIPMGTSDTAPIRQGLIRIHKYRRPAGCQIVFCLCDVCNEAVKIVGL